MSLKSKLIYIWDLYIAPMLINATKQEDYFRSMRQKYNKPMSTLVIHPKDASTDFLIPIYADIKEATVLRGGHTKDEVRDLIEKHDRVIMLGHGAPGGLFSVGQFDGYGMIIDQTMVEALSMKKDNIYIWCNADQFVQKHNLKGFYTGMFISEYSEADYCRVSARKGEVERSNDLFAQIVGRNVNESVDVIWRRAKRVYQLENNQVAVYNNNRLYLAN
jgi:hypothetical protein